ncbi:MAG: hypothetical protein JWQ21_400 [Herminiimonas sp.]|nr:hypothetical protein [Herminiimonas sp.]
MRTKEHGDRAVAQAKQVKRYRTDLTDEEWQAVAPLMPPHQFNVSRRFKSTQKPLLS